jgi:protease I
LLQTDFEHVDLTEPRKALEEQGAEARIVSPAKGQVQAWKHFDHSDKFRVDVPLDAADADDFDALVPPVAAICHGPTEAQFE